MTSVWTQFRLITLVVLALGMLPAHADIVHFINPAPGEQGHYDWHWQEWGDEPSDENWLNITRSSSLQQGGTSGSSVGQVFLGDFNEWNNVTHGGAALVRLSGFLITRALKLGDSIQGDFQIFLFHAGDFDGTSDFPIEEVRYMGVRTDAGNFGWIAVIRGGTGHHEYSFLALEWAYETIPGKPIRAGEVPAPGGLGVLTLSLLFGPHKPRREGAAH